MKIFFGFFNPFFLCVLDKGYNSRLKAIETAKKMKLNDMPLETIAEYVGLSVEEIEKL